jgi:hypothetical protein
MKIGAALVVAGALSIGAAACGSGSDSAGSTSVVKKEAGVFGDGTRLAVVNKSPEDITVQICAVNVSCKDSQQLRYGQSVDMANDTSSVADVNGWIRYSKDMRSWESGTQPIQVDFAADNPDVGQPNIELTTSSETCDLGQVAFRQRFPGDWDSAPLELGENAEQQSTRSSLCQYKLVGSRAADSGGYKQLTLTAYGQGADFPDIPYAG